MADKTKVYSARLLTETAELADKLAEEEGLDRRSFLTRLVLQEESFRHDRKRKKKQGDVILNLPKHIGRRLVDVAESRGTGPTLLISAMLDLVEKVLPKEGGSIMARFIDHFFRERFFEETRGRKPRKIEYPSMKGMGKKGKDDDKKK